MAERGPMMKGSEEPSIAPTGAAPPALHALCPLFILVDCGNPNS